MTTIKALVLFVMFNNDVGIDPYSINVDDAVCLTKNIYFEARGEPAQGQLAVAYVTINRANHPKYPNTICEVVYDSIKSKKGIPLKNKCNFSWYCDEIPDTIEFFKLDSKTGKYVVRKENYEAAQFAAKIAVYTLAGLGEDNCKGATHYYNYKKVNPEWSNKFLYSCTYGNHRFLNRGKQ